ncbi:MAG: hypothetical protein AB7G06_08840 [Bdellovibrionales bacterium]
MPSALPNPQETYGVHILKAFAITMQILAHSYMWLIHSQVIHLRNLINWQDYIGMIMGALVLALPMTAGAVLRLTTQVDTMQNRAINIPWSAIGWTMLVLALIESTKHALMWQAGHFFMWDVLHLVAVSVLLTLAIARFSIPLLWSIALAIIFVTPFLIDMLAPIETQIPVPPDSLDWLAGAILSVITAFIVLLIVRSIVRHPAITQRYRVRTSLAVALLGIGIIGLLIAYMPTTHLTLRSLSLLPLGAAIGTMTGGHIWPLFPWAGCIMAGFLIYDLIVRKNASPRFMISLFLIGAALLVFFFRYYGPLFFVTFSDHSFTSAAFFNRSPSAPLMVVGVFCLMAPVSYWLARMGAEKSYIVAISRNILWIYLYQTSLLVIAAQHVNQIMPGRDGVIAYTAFALASSLALPFILRLIPFNVRLSVTRST